MIRVLVFGMTENPGGVESFLINYYRNIDREKVQFDFLCNSHEAVAYEDELISLGGRTFHITARSKNRVAYKRELEAVFREHASEWTAIWVNVCSLANIDYLKVAKKYGIKKRIIHSHNSQNMDNVIRGILHNWNKRNISKYATDYWACSEDAAKWFYTNDNMKRAVVIHNAIDVERMKYDGNKRKALQEQYGIQNRFVIGNVGRLHFQKNQKFAIEVFCEYHKKHPESVLVLVGQGEDEEILRRKAKDCGIEQDVKLVGIQKDIQAWLSCFDLFLFPSVFEGLSIAALEAQVNGLPVIASKGVIPEEVRMNENFVFCELDSGTEKWCDLIEKMHEKDRIEYDIIKKNFVKNGYDIRTEVKKLEKFLTR